MIHERMMHGDEETGKGKAPGVEYGIMRRTIQQNNRSGTFSAKADYTPLSDGNVRIDDWCFDSLGILPSGTDVRFLPLSEAQAEYKERMENGWTV